MSIRRATIHDWEAIQSLLVQLDYPGAVDLPLAKMERMIHDPEGVLLVYEGSAEVGEAGGRIGAGLVEAEGKIAAGLVEAEGAGKILGFLSLHFIPQIALQGDFARISYFAVDESTRGKGVGKEMEEYCTRLARERGCHLIEVHCHTRRVRAHDFYFRQGYAESPKYLVKRLE
jgi:GNAT superfamily N-acetyltransferase